VLLWVKACVRVRRSALPRARGVLAGCWRIARRDRSLVVR
jgi:hypothetical protein